MQNEIHELKGAIETNLKEKDSLRQRNGETKSLLAEKKAQLVSSKVWQYRKHAQVA